MNASPVNRQTQGIPAGGQFAASTHAEFAVGLQAPAGLPFVLGPGESEDYSEYADGDVVTRLSVLRSDDGGTFHVEASKFLNLKDIIPAQDLHTDDAWLDANSAVIEDFFRSRCNAEADSDDWEDVRIDCSVFIQSDSVTGPQISEVWNRSNVVPGARVQQWFSPPNHRLLPLVLVLLLPNPRIFSLGLRLRRGSAGQTTTNPIAVQHAEKLRGA